MTTYLTYLILIVIIVFSFIAIIALLAIFLQSFLPKLKFQFLYSFIYHRLFIEILSIYFLYFIIILIFKGNLHCLSYQQAQDFILFFDISDWFTEKVRDTWGDYRIYWPKEDWPEDLQKKYPELYTKSDPDLSSGPDGNDSRYASDIDKEREDERLRSEKEVIDALKKKYDHIFKIISDHSSDTESESNEVDESATNSDSSSDLDPSERYSPTILFNAYKSIIAPCKNPEQVVKQSMMFMERMFPEELLATTPEDLKNPKSDINLFQDRALQELDLRSVEDCLQFLTFRTMISVYNTKVLCNIKDYALLQKVFEQTLTMQVNQSIK